MKLKTFLYFSLFLNKLKNKQLLSEDKLDFLLTKQIASDQRDLNLRAFKSRYYISCVSYLSMDVHICMYIYYLCIYVYIGVRGG